MKKEVKRIGIWDITSKCNLKCRHCYNQERYWEKADHYNELSSEEIEKILDKLSLMSFTRVHLLGGEPLLAKNIEFLVQYARKLNLEVTMVSNGTLLDSKMFINMCMLGVKSISISIDGTNQKENDCIRGEGAFSKTVNNIKNAVKIRETLGSNILLFLSFTLTKINCRQSYNLPEFAEELGVDGVNVSYLSNEGAAREEFDSINVTEEEKFLFIDKVIESHKKHRGVSLHIDARSLLAEYIYKKHGEDLVTDELGCKGGDKQFYILADGQMLPCSPAGTSIGQNKKIFSDEVRYPNLILDSVEDIANSESFIYFYNYTRSTKTYEDIYPCSICKYPCTACPLLYSVNKNVDECIMAQTKIKRLDKEIMESIFRRKNNLRITDMGEKIEILNFFNQNRYEIEGVALDIWNRLNGEKPVEQIAEEIFEEYQDNDSISIETVKEDVLQYIYHLKSLNFIVENEMCLTK